MICYFNFIVINQQYLFCRVVAIKPASGRLIVSKMNCDLLGIIENKIKI